MVNLLFISSNLKIEAIKTALQPLLKLKIDIVFDFDYGLKDVFEKRPAIVFIQDQIAGVTGESVARHIQMLLGSGAPTFILMHDGNIKTKLIKGLYEYLIDLSQSDTKVLESIQSTLESVLGPQWSKIYVPPSVNSSVVKNAWSVPLEQRDVADKMVDDLVSDLGTVTHSFNTNSSFPEFDIPESAPEEPFLVVSSPHDQLDEIIAASASEQKKTGNVTAVESALVSKNVSVTPVKTSAPDKSIPAAISRNVQPPRAPGGVVSSDTSATTPAVPPDHGSSASVSIPKNVLELSPVVPTSPAEFTFGRGSASAEKVTENVFEGMQANYRSKQVACRLITITIALLIVSVAGGYWYLVKHKSHLPELLVKPSSPATVSAPVHKAMTSSTSVVQRPQSAARKNVNNTETSLIPLSGNDQMFVSQKPGWERYVGTDFEMRMYRSGGKLKAVQVLATKGHVLSESRLKKILIELTGTDVYKITSQEQKHGFDLSHATINRKADLLIYRKKSIVHAFVVSLN